MNSIYSIEKRIDRIYGVFLDRQNKLTSYKNKIDVLSADLKLHKEALDLAKVCIARSLDSKRYIESILSTGLTDVMGEKRVYTLEIVLDEDGSVKGLKNKLMAEGGTPIDPLDSFGTAEIAIISALFRIALLLLTTGTKRIIIFDEPFGNINPALQARIKVFIENLCKNNDLQLILITHLSEPFGKVIEVKKTKSTPTKLGESKIEILQ